MLTLPLLKDIEGICEPIVVGIITQVSATKGVYEWGRRSSSTSCIIALYQPCVMECDPTTPCLHFVSTNRHETDYYLTHRRRTATPEYYSVNAAFFTWN